jgi:hypothetical protein
MTTWSMLEPNFLTNSYDFPSDTFKEDQSIFIMLSDLCVDLVIHRAKFLSVGDTWNQKSWILVDVTGPWLVDKLISDDVFTVFKLLGYIAPEPGKFISEAIFIVI